MDPGDIRWYRVLYQLVLYMVVLAIMLWASETLLGLEHDLRWWGIAYGLAIPAMVLGWLRKRRRQEPRNKPASQGDGRSRGH